MASPASSARPPVPTPSPPLQDDVSSREHHPSSETCSKNAAPASAPLSPTSSSSLNKDLQQKVKHLEELNGFLSQTVQDLHHRIRKEQLSKEEMKQELVAMRQEKKNADPSSQPTREPHAKLEQELEHLRGQLDKEKELNATLERELAYTKQMLEAEGRTRLMVEERNTLIEEENKTVIMDKLVLQQHCDSLRHQLGSPSVPFGRPLVAQLKRNAAAKGAGGRTRAGSWSAAASERVLHTSMDAESLMTRRIRTKGAEAQLEEVRARLDIEMQARMRLQEGKAKLEAELEDLTRTLFEEANEMVSTEAREKYEILQSKIRLESELEQTRSRLQLDEEMLRGLKEKFSKLEQQQQSEKRRSRRINHSRQNSASLPAPSSPISSINGSPSSPARAALLDTKMMRNSSAPNLKGAEHAGSLSSEFTVSSVSCSNSSPEQSETSSVDSHDGADVPAVVPTETETEGDDLYVSDYEFEEEEQEEEDSVIIHIHTKLDIQQALTQFIHFLSLPKLEFSGTKLMDRLLRDDVGPALRLRYVEDKSYRKLLEAVWNNRCFIEVVSVPVEGKCQGCDAEPACKYSMRLDPSSKSCIFLGEMCRERIVRVCDLYQYLRNIKSGYVKNVALVDMWKETTRLRMRMAAARVCAG
eukprot:TRINITY_DN1381_c1_g1_i7.p1 TRINITY_DN1381_c1_g1~~TRINITY_DN1381_c1_g1_i7.p1  ORF type:complete len:642 (+),score=224.23 TRINITY_DN1381_c1_g1_i7:197-2122(+)